VRSWERAKGLTRIEFAAGNRALADYRRANKTSRTVAALFSASRDDAAKLAARMVDENKELHRRVRSLEEIAARVEAQELLAAASPNAAGVRVVTHVFENRDAESLKHVAQALIANPNTIALLGSREKEAARLVFARSADTSGDMNLMMRAACELLDGRGGGKPDMAQGAGKNVERLGDAIENAVSSL
jgi:alanyl-tRNA synthetase